MVCQMKGLILYTSLILNSSSNRNISSLKAEDLHVIPIEKN